jgi:phosphoesterase RecJ-like protein
MGYLLYERMQVLPALHTAYMTVSLDDEARFGLLPGETEGFVNLALSLRGVNLGVLLSEKPHEVRFSFRSTGQFAANQFSQRWFNGGGHYNAAGGRLPGVRMPEAEAFFLEKLQLVADELRYDTFG